MRLPKEVINLFKIFKENNFQLFIVGGAVRDLLLGREVKDWDFTTDAKPEEILKIFPEGFYNNKFGTVGIPQRPASTQRDEQDPEQTTSIFEITTMRKEGKYSDHRHPIEVGWTDKIEEDLKRRDFTINAMALSLKSDFTDSTEFTKPVDPFNGQQDLKNKIIRAVGDPSKRFQEDALRLMRAIRIASEIGFEIEEKTYQAVKDNSQLIKDIAFERIRDELFKILIAQNGYDGLLKLRDTGILQIILPEIEKCFGIIQEGPKHDRIYDIGDHSFRTMRETPSKDPLVKFAALLHDVGKAQTHKIEKDGNVTFYNHDIVGAEISKEISKRFNLSKDQAEKVYLLIRYHMYSTNENQTDSAIRRFIKNVGLENVNDLLALRIGDRLGGDTRKPVSWRMEKFQERIKQVLIKPFSITDLKVNGKDVMEVLQITPSPKVGEVLNNLFEEVLEDASKNTREYLLDRIKNLKSEDRKE